MKEIIQIITNEDGDVYGAVYPHRKLTRLGALRAINKELISFGIEDEVKITLEDLTECRFWRTAGGEQHDNWIWWEKPDKAEYNFDTVEDLGIGWIYYIGEIDRT